MQYHAAEAEPYGSPYFRATQPHLQAMMISPKITLCLMLVFLASLRGAEILPALELQAKTLVEEIKNGRIASVQLLLVPSLIETQVNIRSEVFFNLAEKTNANLKEQSEPRRNALLGALLKIRGDPKPVKAQENLDLRFGLKFFDRDSQEIHSLLIAGFGENGILDGQSVSGTRETMEWLIATSAIPPTSPVALKWLAGTVVVVALILRVRLLRRRLTQRRTQEEFNLGFSSRATTGG